MIHKVITGKQDFTSKQTNGKIIITNDDWWVWINCSTWRSDFFSSMLPVSKETIEARNFCDYISLTVNLLVSKPMTILKVSLSSKRLQREPLQLVLVPSQKITEVNNLNMDPCKSLILKFVFTWPGKGMQPSTLFWIRQSYTQEHDLSLIVCYQTNPNPKEDDIWYKPNGEEVGTHIQ